MDTNFRHVIKELGQNKSVFQHLLTGISNEQAHWRPAPGKWSLLEIICHLYDEEREDFRYRVWHLLNKPEEPLPKLDPMAWVSEYQYENQRLPQKLNDFIIERENSIHYLQQLQNPDWDRFFEHPSRGMVTARFFLNNWLAHDHIHIRQIIRTKFQYFKFVSGEDLSYAGEW